MREANNVKYAGAGIVLAGLIALVLFVCVLPRSVPGASLAAPDPVATAIDNLGNKLAKPLADIASELQKLRQLEERRK